MNSHALDPLTSIPPTSRININDSKKSESDEDEKSESSRINEIEIKEPYRLFTENEKVTIEAYVKELTLKAQHTIRNHVKKVPSFSTELTIIHLIRECIEVISWLETKKNNYTLFFYSGSSLPKSLLYDIGKAKEVKLSDPKVKIQNRTERTLNLGIDSLTTQSQSRKSFANTDIKLDDIKANANKKMFIPISYAFRGAKTPQEIEHIVDTHIAKNNIPAECISIFLGPTEDPSRSISNNIRRRKEKINTWIEANKELFIQKKVKLITHENYDISKDNAVYVDQEWYKTVEIKTAKQVFLAIISNQEYRLKLGDFLLKDTLSHLQEKVLQMVHDVDIFGLDISNQSANDIMSVKPKLDISNQPSNNIAPISHEDDLDISDELAYALTSSDSDDSDEERFLSYCDWFISDDEDSLIDNNFSLDLSLSAKALSKRGFVGFEKDIYKERYSRNFKISSLRESLSELGRLVIQLKKSPLKKSALEYVREKLNIIFNEQVLVPGFFSYTLFILLFDAIKENIETSQDKSQHCFNFFDSKKSLQIEILSLIRGMALKAFKLNLRQLKNSQYIEIDMRQKIFRDALAEPLFSSFIRELPAYLQPQYTRTAQEIMRCYNEFNSDLHYYERVSLDFDTSNIKDWGQWREEAYWDAKRKAWMRQQDEGSNGPYYNTSKSFPSSF